MLRFLLVISLAALAVAGCGGGGSSDSGKPSGGGSERTAVEKAARGYIVQQQSDETDTEQAGALSFTSVDVNGDQAEAKATSSLSGNKYTATLRKQSGSWQGLTLLTNRPSPAAGAGGNPASGPGKSISTDHVEAQIQAGLVRALGLKGKVVCPARIKVRRGNDFECKVTGSRQATIRVTQKDDQGHLNYKVTLRK